MEQKKTPPPPPAKNGNGRSDQHPANTSFTVAGGVVGGADRILVYGTGGIGKSTFASLAPNPVFIDVEDGTRKIDVRRIGGVSTFADLRECLRSNVLDEFQTVVIDSGTRAEELAVAHTLLTVPHEKGKKVNRVEDYGFGKGYQHIYEVFLLLLSDLDVLVRRGKNVVIIAHDCVADVPNPVGEDYIRYEPHFQSPKSGKASIRNRVIQWADYVLFMGYDVITEDGKGIGGGTRTIFTTERPDHIAKSRTKIEPLAFENEADNAMWQAIMKGSNQ